MGNYGMEETKRSGFGTASLVLGIIGICTSFIPIINNLSFIMGILAFIFAIVSLVKKAGKGKAIAGLILGVLAVVITLSSQKTLSDTLDTVSNSIDQATGGNTEQVLQDELEVNVGKFEVEEDEYGLTNTSLTVDVKNKSTEMKSGNIQIEAVDSDGSRIANDYVYINNLNAGQSQSFKCFEYVTSENLEKMKNATFKIVEASTY